MQLKDKFNVASGGMRVQVSYTKIAFRVEGVENVMLVDTETKTAKSLRKGWGTIE